MKARTDPIKNGPAPPLPVAAPPVAEQPDNVLTMDDVNVLLRSYQQQIMAKAGEVASLNMELARKDRIIAALRMVK